MKRYSVRFICAACCILAVILISTHFFSHSPSSTPISDGSKQPTTNSGHSSRTDDEKLRAKRGSPATPGAKNQESEKSPKTQSIGPDGRLTLNMIKEAGLTDEEAIVVQSRLDDMRGRMTELVRSKIKEDPGKSDPEKGVYGYVIPSFKEEGQQVLSDLARDLAAKVGKSKAAVIMGGVPEKSSMYSSFGSLDTYFQISSPGEVKVPDDIPEETYYSMIGGRESLWRVRLQLTEPSSGVLRGGSDYSLAGLKTAYGDIISVPEIK
ncbi:MAG: hypothetical protein QM755_08705 [Luteolibacter sp.]